MNSSRAMEEVDQATSAVKAEPLAELSLVQGAMVLTEILDSKPQPDLVFPRAAEDAVWATVHEGESTSSDCGGASDLQELGSASGEEGEGDGSEASDTLGARVSPVSKGSWDTSQQNGDEVDRDQQEKSRSPPVTGSTFPGKQETNRPLDQRSASLNPKNTT